MPPNYAVTPDLAAIVAKAKAAQAARLNPDTATPPPASTQPIALQAPPDADPQAAALWALAAAAPALVTDRGWGGAGSCARDWRGVELDGDRNVTSVDVSEGGVHAFPASVFAALPSLSCLLASTNALRGLPTDTVAATSLTALHLANNALTDLPTVVCDLPALRVLNVGLNPLRELPPSITRLSALEWLDASECRLTEVDAVGDLTALTRLDLHSNRIVSLPPTVGRLVRLERLSLHSNELEEVVDELGHATALQWLSLNSNKLTHLPASLGALTNLTRLSLHINRLALLPPSLSSKLEALSLFTNQLTELPAALLAGLGDCVRLSAWGNRLTSVPSTIGAMTSLQELWLNNNELTQLPPDIGRCSSLVRLWVNGNQLTALPDQLGDCGHLQEISADANPGLTGLPTGLERARALRRIQVGPECVTVPDGVRGCVVCE